MIDTYLRETYQKWCITPILKKIVANKLQPNVITAAALVTGMAIMPALALQWTWIALTLLFLSGYCDTLDGSLAREMRNTSPKGAVFDIVSDRVVEFSIILGFYCYAPDERSLPCILMLGSVLICVTSFLVVGIFIDNKTHKSFHYSPGFMERSEAFLFFSTMILLPGFFSLLAYSFAALVAYTALMRIWEFGQDASASAH